MKRLSRPRQGNRRETRLVVERLEDRRLLSLVAAYSFNEGTGTTAADASGSGNTATLANAAWTTGGKFGSALSFNGTNSWVTVNDSPSLDLTSGMTLEAWVNPTTLSSWRSVLLKERPNGLSYSLYATDPNHSPSAASSFINTGKADVDAWGTTALPLNAWTHLAATYDGSALRMYVNGALVRTTAVSGTLVVSSGALRIGGNSIWGEFFRGLIDEVRVYNQPLSQTQIQTDMNTPLGQADTIPPTVSITAPANNATVSGTTTISATAADNVAVAGVQFRLDGVNLGTEDTTAPYSFSWNASTATVGLHTLTAVARDTSNNTTTSTAVTVNVAAPADTTPPTVSITAPANNATVSGTTTISATAADNVAVAGVQFWLDGVNLGTEDTTAPYSFSWNTVGTTNGSHTLSAVARDAAGNATVAANVAVTVNNPVSNLLTVDGAQTFQTIDGLGASINSLSWNNGQLQPAIDMLADQMGVNTWRVVFDMEDWEATNDNADPNTPDLAYYANLYSSAKFQNLWGTLRYLNQKGFNSSITLSFMGQVPSWMGGNHISANMEDEWVETISTLVYYARNSANVQFTTLDPLNEPDWDGIEGPQVDAVQYTRLLDKLSVKLDSMGLSDVRLLGPNTAQITTGVNTYMPQMMSDSVVMNKVDHFAFHNYSGDTGGAYAAIKSSAYPNTDLWMSEVTNPPDMMSMLGQNASAVLIWEGYDSVYNHAILAGRGTTAPNDAGNGPAPLAYNSTTGIYTPRPSFYQDAQLFKYVPQGSVRIGATESNANLTMLAFYHAADGRVTIVGRNASSSSLPVSGVLNNLPALSSLQFYLTDATNNFARGSDVTVSNGAFSFIAPGNSIFTLTTLAVPDTSAPTVAISAPAASATVAGTVTISATATDNIGVAGVQFLLDNNVLGAEDTTAPYSITWNTAGVANGTHTLSARARDAAGNQTTSTGISVLVNNVADPTPPTVSVTAPANGAAVSSTVAVSATAADNVGVAGVQFLLDGVNLGAEVLAAPYTINWNTATVANGTHVLTARARDAAGNQTTSTGVSVNVNNPVAAAGLVAAFSFNEGTGTTAADASGLGNTATLSNTVWSTSGKYGGALSFNGTNSWVTVNDSPSLDLTSGMTLEAWVDPTALSSWRAVVLKERPNGLSYSLYATDPNHSPSAASAFINTGGSDVEAWGTAALPLNTWTHVAATYDGSALRMYVNGVLVRTTAASGNMVVSNGALRIGGDSIWGEYFQGLIDEVRVYNQPLSQAQIQTDMNTPLSVGAAALLAAATTTSTLIPTVNAASTLATTVDATSSLATAVDATSSLASARTVPSLSGVAEVLDSMNPSSDDPEPEYWAHGGRPDGLPLDRDSTSDLAWTQRPGFSASTATVAQTVQGSAAGNSEVGHGFGPMSPASVDAAIKDAWFAQYDLAQPSAFDDLSTECADLRV